MAAKEKKSKFGLESSEIEEYRRQIRQITDSKTLETIYNKYPNDIPLCFYLAQNKHTPGKIISKLAQNSNDLIRAGAARRSDLIDDLDVLKKLAMDKYEIRKQLARTTTNEEIKVLLFKSNPHNLDIREICIKRIEDMDKIEELLLKSNKPEKNVNNFVDSLLYNPKVDSRILKIIIEIAELSDEQVAIINELAEKLNNERTNTEEHI